MKTSAGVRRPGRKPPGAHPTRRAARNSASYFKYFSAVVLLILGVLVLRSAIAWAAEGFVYTLPFVGGLLKSLELMEVSNVVVFAILGVGLGACTLWIPRQRHVLIKAVPLVLAVPIVFLIGYGVRHHLWVQQVAIQSELLPAQAEQVTNRLLVGATGQEGLWGFFQYTVEVPVLPTDLSALQSIDAEDKWFRSELTRLIGLQPGIFSRLFYWAGWGLRLFYLLLALITAIIYFAKGLLWANGRQKA